MMRKPQLLLLSWSALFLMVLFECKYAATIDISQSIFIAAKHPVRDPAPPPVQEYECSNNEDCEGEHERCEHHMCVCVEKAVRDPDADTCYIPLAKHDEKCDEDIRCDGDKLICDEESLTCKCKNGMQYDDVMKMCLNKHDEDCDDDSPCVSGLVCEGGTGRCACQSPFVYNNGSEVCIPAGYSETSDPKKFIRIETTELAWDAARSNCQSDDANGRSDLLVIESSAINDDTTSLIASELGIGQGLIIGLRQNSLTEYEWVDGRILTIQPGRLQNSGEPDGYQIWLNTAEIDDNAGGVPDGEDCIGIYYETAPPAKWVDISCTPAFKSLCQFVLE